MPMAMTLKCIFNVAQVRPKSCHETVYINIRIYKICNQIKTAGIRHARKSDLLAINSEANFGFGKHT